MALALATLLMLLCERLLVVAAVARHLKCLWAETVRQVVAVVRRMSPMSAELEAKAALEAAAAALMTSAATLHEAVMAALLAAAAAL